MSLQLHKAELLSHAIVSINFTVYFVWQKGALSGFPTAS